MEICKAVSAVCGACGCVYGGGEVLMDLLQPELMSRIADDGVLGVHTGGVGDIT